MSIKYRMRRSLGAGLAGAMVLALMPAGAAFADGHEDVCEGAPESTDFQDQGSISSTFEEYVECMQAYGIARGFPDGTYRPGQFVTRQQMALFIARFISQAERGDTNVPPTAASDYPDRDDATPEARAAIDYLTERGVVEGFRDGTYRPGANVTRAQMASYIARAMEEAVGAELDEGDGDNYPDVDDAATHSDNINKLTEAGIVRGFRDGTYRPAANVTRQQMAQFIILGAAELLEQGLWEGAFVEEEDPEPGEPAELTLTPTDVTKALGTAVTLTASLADDAGTATDGLVRFEVYRDEGGNEASVETGAVVESEGGEATFTYTGPDDVVVDDYVIACVVPNNTTPCVDGDTIEFDPVTGAVRTGIDQEPNDTAIVRWVEAIDAVVSLTLTPESDVNVFGDTHTVTAMAWDETGANVEDIEVRFEVYRDTALEDDEDNFFAAPVHADTGTTDEDGAETSYTYPGQLEASDIIVACVRHEDEPGLCAEVEDGSVVTDEDNLFTATATKDWVEAELSITLTPASSVNPVGTEHTVTATVTDQFGDEVEGATVTFEVYRDTPTVPIAQVDFPEEVATVTTDEDGEASLTYDGPEVASTDTIFACIGAGPCTELTAFGQVVVDPDVESASATKEWIEVDEEAEAGTYEGEILDFDDPNGLVESMDVWTGEEFVRLLADGNDLYRVDGTPVTRAAFTAALEAGASDLVAEYNPGPDPGDQSTFWLSTDD